MLWTPTLVSNQEDLTEGQKGKVTITVITPLWKTQSPNSPTRVTRHNNTLPQLRVSSPRSHSTNGRLEGIRRHLRDRAIPESAGKLIIASWRPKIKASYYLAWRKWKEWCTSHRVPTFSASVSDSLGFLAHHFEQGKQFHSALSSCDPPIEGFLLVNTHWCLDS